MKENELALSKKERNDTVRARISKVAFPEICPVCMNEAEDLVALAIAETSVDRWAERKALVSTWSRTDKMEDITTIGPSSAVTFWIPACFLHGSHTITTPKKKIASIAVFMLLFYPLLYFFLELLTAVQYSRPTATALFATVALLAAMTVSITYGFYPRAIER